MNRAPKKVSVGTSVVSAVPSAAAAAGHIPAAAPKKERLQLGIKTLTGIEITAKVAPTATVAGLKQHINKLLHIPQPSMDLVFKGNLVSDDQTFQQVKTSRGLKSPFH